MTSCCWPGFPTSTRDCDHVPLAAPPGRAPADRGLAALLLGGPRRRPPALRGLLSSGAAVRHGLPPVRRPGPVLRAVAQLADRLWEALHGHDAWPAGLARVGARTATARARRLAEPAGAARAAVGIVRDDRTGLLVLILSDDEPVGPGPRCGARGGGRKRRRGRTGRRPATAPVSVCSPPTPRSAARCPMLPGRATTERRAPGPYLRDLPGAVCRVRGTGDGAAPRPTAPCWHCPAGPGRRGGPADRRGLAPSPRSSAQAPALAARHPLDPAITAPLAPSTSAHKDGTSSWATSPGSSGHAPPASLADRRSAGHTGRAVESHRAAGRERAASCATPSPGSTTSARARRLGPARPGPRDRGARLLLTGPPGTGKSLAAARRGHRRRHRPAGRRRLPDRVQVARARPRRTWPPRSTPPSGPRPC